MISRAEIEKLAKLSRLKLSSEEIDRMQGEMGAILGYVDKLKEATGSVAGSGMVLGGPVMSVNKNVMREDANAHEGGINTEKLLNLAPRRKDNFVQVKKIL